jgi:hypothetical protein
MAESFFAVLKNERVHRTQYPTRMHAYRDIARAISAGTTPAAVTQDFSTGARNKSTTSGWNSRPQRELVINPLSGKRGAHHGPRENR